MKNVRILQSLQNIADYILPVIALELQEAKKHAEQNLECDGFGFWDGNITHPVGRFVAPQPANIQGYADGERDFPEITQKVKEAREKKLKDNFLLKHTIDFVKVSGISPAEAKQKALELFEVVKEELMALGDAPPMFF